jgi:solute carrier family 25 uncoupling protein 8/9
MQVQTAGNMVQQEGLVSLWSGLGPSLARSFLYGGARLGFYSPIKSLMGGDGKAHSMSVNIAAGCTSG